jgi:hypothetical protein
MTTTRSRGYANPKPKPKPEAMTRSVTVTVTVTIAEIVEESDPFNIDSEKVNFVEKSKGSPFARLTKSNARRFVKRNKTIYMLSHPDM